MHAKYYVFYKILRYLSDSIGNEVIDEWCEQLVPVYASKSKFVIYIADDDFRTDFVRQYTSRVNEALNECFDSMYELEIWGETEMARYAESQQAQQLDNAKETHG